MHETDPDRTALFLDFDGTLVEIAGTPDSVVVPDVLPALLDEVRARLGGALAVVSGRPVREIDAHLAPARLPAAGLHGVEWRFSDTVEDLPAPDSLAEVRAMIAASGLSASGVRVEDKGSAIALHYREVPELGATAAAMADRAVRDHRDLAVLAGKMVYEIKPRAVGKGAAVRRFMEAAPFAGRVPVYVGDDVTDEDGMAAALAAGGSAIKVGPGETVAPRRFAGPVEVIGWLAGFVRNEG